MPIDWFPMSVCILPSPSGSDKGTECSTVCSQLSETAWYVWQTCLFELTKKVSICFKNIVIATLGGDLLFGSKTCMFLKKQVWKCENALDKDAVDYTSANVKWETINTTEGHSVIAY